MAETTVLRSSSIIRNASPNATSGKPHAQMSGALPVVNVNMNAGGPQQQGGHMVKQGVTILPPKAGTQRFTTGGLPNQPAKQGVVILPPKELRGAAGTTPSLTADQLLLCRHLVDKYLGEQRAKASEALTSTPNAAVEGTVEGSVEGTVAIVEGAAGADSVKLTPAAADNVFLAESTIVSIDAAMVALTAAAAMAAAAAATPPPPPQQAVATGAAPQQQQTQRIPAPRAVAAGPRSQVAASAAPRRIARPGATPPPVAVRMDAGRPVPDTAPSAPPPVIVTMDGGPLIPMDPNQGSSDQG